MVHGLETMERLNQRAIERTGLDQRPQISMDYPQALLQMWRFTDSLASRFALGCVRVSFEKGLIDATDGRIAVRHSLDVPPEFRDCADVMFNGECLQRVAKHAHRNRYSRSRLRLCKDGQMWTAGDGRTSFVLQLGEGRFPNIETILGQPIGDSAIELTLNMLLLSQLSNAFKSYDNSHQQPAVRLLIPTNGSPTRWRIKVEPDGPSVEALMMPMQDASTPNSKPVRVTKPASGWRPATGEDCGRLARFRSAESDFYSYGMLIEVLPTGFYSGKLSSHESANTFVYPICEVQE